MSCPGLDLIPLSSLLACFLPFYSPGARWLPSLPRTWVCFRFLFHEILSQENLPLLLWQAGDHYHFRAREGEKKLGGNTEFKRFLLEMRILRRREVKGLGGVD